MTLEEATREVRNRAGEDVGIPKAIKVDFGKDGIIHLDGRVTPNAVSNENKDADVTIRCSLKTFLDITAGKANPQLALMMGKIKVDGDKSLALQFARTLR